MTQTQPAARWRRRRLVAFFALLGATSITVCMSSCSTLVAPDAQWLAQSRKNPPTTFSHSLLDEVLTQYVDGQGNVDYRNLKAAPTALEHYYATLAAFSPDSHASMFANADSRLAYWLNAYNGAVLLSVSRLYPMASVEDVGVPFALFFLPDTAGFFYLRNQIFGGVTMSLYDLENDIVRARFQDPRIHFALNCASAGCPRLPMSTFGTATLNEDLDRETRRFFAEKRNLEIDHEARVVRLSQIMQWYESDFTDWLREHANGANTLLAYAARYCPDDVREQLTGRAADYALEFRTYDWRLNDRGLER